ncbi:MAG: energy transducer TonB [Hyphomicrobiales bacterium]|nr:energy transducer TonB [Hyphomicrobiales bacterium]
MAYRLPVDDEAAVGPVPVARRDAPALSAATDRSNVVAFVRRRRAGEAPALPLPAVEPRPRSDPQHAAATIRRSVLLATASLVLHGAFVAMFWQSPRPMASVGIEAMTVEITLGATTAAGLAQQTGEQETQVAPPSEQQSQIPTPLDQARLTTPMPRELPVAERDAAPEASADPDRQTAEPAPSDPRATPVVTETQPQPLPQPVDTAPERTRIAAPTDTTASKRQVTTASPTDSASGIGRGRSNDAANYNGRVAAHLARYKQYPATARSAGIQGIATVSFSIDGSGRITAARLANGSGHEVIDQEVVAMVRRASPFPRPPDGQPRNFTVPVRFNLR